MPRPFRAVIAAAAVLLGGCANLLDRDLALDDDDLYARPNAALFLGFHGPVERMGGPPE